MKTLVHLPAQSCEGIIFRQHPGLCQAIPEREPMVRQDFTIFRKGFGNFHIPILGFKADILPP